jgi:hypothetical protein
LISRIAELKTVELSRDLTDYEVKEIAKAELKLFDNISLEDLENLIIEMQVLQQKESKTDNSKFSKFKRFADSQINNSPTVELSKKIWQKFDRHLDGNGVGNKFADIIQNAKIKFQKLDKERLQREQEHKDKLWKEYIKNKAQKNLQNNTEIIKGNKNLEIVLAILAGSLITSVGLVLNGDIKGVKGIKELIGEQQLTSTLTDTIKEAERNDETTVGNELPDMAVKFETELPSELLSFEQNIKEAGARGEVSPSNPDSVAMFLRKEFLSDVTIMGEEDVRKYIVSINFLEKKGLLIRGISEQTAYSGLGQLQELLEKIKNEENVNPKNIARLENNIIFLTSFLKQNSTLPNKGIYKPQVEVEKLQSDSQILNDLRKKLLKANTDKEIADTVRKVNGGELNGRYSGGITNYWDKLTPGYNPGLPEVKVPQKPSDYQIQPFNPTPNQQDTREFTGQPIPPKPNPS